MSKRKKLLYDTEQVSLCLWASVSFSVKWRQESVEQRCACLYLSEPGFVATASSQGVTSLAAADFSVDGGLAGASDRRHTGLAPMSPQHALVPVSPHRGPCQEPGGTRAAPHCPCIPSTPSHLLCPAPRCGQGHPGCLGPFLPFTGGTFMLSPQPSHTPPGQAPTADYSALPGLLD